MSKDTYHHGSLDQALLDAVGELIEADGVGAVTLRGAARRAGVSHSAPAHHFETKQGMLTAFAKRGFERFESVMRRAYESAGDDPEERLNALGRQYILFAVEETPYFEVMFRKELVDPDDPELRAISEEAFGILMNAVEGVSRAGGAQTGDTVAAAIRAWSQVHGMAMLWLGGAISMFTDDELPEIIEAVFASDRLHRSGAADTEP